jgi:arsenite methyltransferase
LLARARHNLRTGPVSNATFVHASAEKLPFMDQSFHVVISDGVFNLIPDKVSALTKILRVLKPEGRSMMGDPVFTGELPDDTAARVARWAR